MLNSKRKKIYIGIIAVCIVGIIVVLSLKGRSGGVAGPLPGDTLTNPVGTTSNTPVSSGTTPTSLQNLKFLPPQVFPFDRSFDLSIFDSSTFQALSPIGEITLQDGELGNENPF